MMLEPLTRRYVSITEAAKVFGVSSTTVRRWIDAGHLAAVQIGPRVRIPIAALEAAAVPVERGADA